MRKDSAFLVPLLDPCEERGVGLPGTKQSSEVGANVQCYLLTIVLPHLLTITEFCALKTLPMSFPMRKTPAFLAPLLAPRGEKGLGLPGTWDTWAPSGVRG